MGTGIGGRNQVFALGMVPVVAAMTRPALHADLTATPARHATAIAFGSIGTDGIDGPTDAAGAIVDSTTAQRAAARELDPTEFLNNNDSFNFFSALDDLVRTGPTGTNVGDVQVALIA
jgi:glycerate 2-kinase